MYCLGSVFNLPNRHCDWSARVFKRYHGAIDTGEPEATPVKHAVISRPMSARTGWENCLSNFGENTTTPSTALRMDSEARVQSVLIPESTQASDDGALLHLGDQPTTPIAQAMLGAIAVESLSPSQYLQQSPTTEHATTNS